MNKVKETTIRYGSVPARHFNRSNESGDTRFVNVAFDPPFGPPKPGKPKGVAQAISVVVTPKGGGVPAVAMAVDVKSTGFTLRARNADPTVEGEAAFDWLAVLGVFQLDAPPLDARLSVLQAKHFGDFLDRHRWPRIWFSTSFDPSSPRVLLLTENNLNIQGDRNPAIVAVADELESLPGLQTDGFSVRAINVDTISGSSGFYAAAFTLGNPATPTGQATAEMWIDHGSEQSTEDYFRNVFPGTPYPVSAGGEAGDSRDFAIYFDRPFLTPPVVLATARETNAVVTIARDVTTHGFTLHARNSDSVPRHALFYWIAIGCVEGCG